jgi:uncharacterized membrane protein YhiD involved in acid resistance
MLFSSEVSLCRVAKQLVLRIGFLGARIIFRDGFNVHGLNTTATLWCSAGVGMMAGAGFWDFALVLTGFVVFIDFWRVAIGHDLPRGRPSFIPRANGADSGRFAAARTLP